MDAETEEILEITARLATEIDRRQAEITKLRCGTHPRDTKTLMRLMVAQSEVEELQDLVDRAMLHVPEVPVLSR